LSLKIEELAICATCFLVGIVIGAGIVYWYFFLRPKSSEKHEVKHKEKPLVTNIEEWRWIDWRGRERRILVRREVK